MALIPILHASLVPAKAVQCLDAQRIEFGPGQKSPPHLHPCPVAGIILQGSVICEVEGRPVQTLKAGDAFYEPANVRVPRFDNAPETEVVCFTAFYLMGHEEEPKLTIL